MKRFFVVFLAVFCMAAAFAQESGKSPFRLSLGGGGFVAGNFATWSVDKDQPGSLYRYNTSDISIAPFLFADFKYLELSLGLPLGWVNGDDTMSGNENFPAQTLGLRGSAYIKYPFTLSPMFSLFPLLGIDYDLCFLAQKDDDRDAKFPISAGNQNAKAMDALNTLWFKAGIGLDVFFTDNVFLRTELLYGLRLVNEMEKYLKDTRSDVNWMLPHGGDFKIAIGYRF